MIARNFVDGDWVTHVVRLLHSNIDMQQQLTSYSSVHAVFALRDGYKLAISAKAMRNLLGAEGTCPHCQREIRQQTRVRSVSGAKEGPSEETLEVAPYTDEEPSSSKQGQVALV